MALWHGGGVPRFCKRRIQWNIYPFYCIIAYSSSEWTSLVYLHTIRVLFYSSTKISFAHIGCESRDILSKNVCGYNAPSSCRSVYYDNWKYIKTKCNISAYFPFNIKCIYWWFTCTVYMNVDQARICWRGQRRKDTKYKNTKIDYSLFSIKNILKLT